MRILVVGMNPAAGKSGRIAKNSTFDKLHRWMDEVTVKHFSFINCFDEICAAPKLNMVDFERLSSVSNDYKVLALGGFASAALNRLKIEHHRLPHPSPRNRLFNDKNFEKIVIKQLKEFLV